MEISELILVGAPKDKNMHKEVGNMQGKLVSKHIWRSSPRSFLCILLLTLIIGFLTVGFGQWYASRQNLIYAEAAYSTVAVIDDGDFWRCTKDMTILDPQSRNTPDPHQLYLEKLAGLDMVRQIDDRQSCRAYSPDAVAVAHDLEDIEIAVGRHQAEMAGDFESMVFLAKHGYPFDYKRFSEGIACGVLVGRCVDIEVLQPYPAGVIRSEIDTTVHGYTERSSLGRLNYAVIFEIDHDQSPALHPLYWDFRYFRVLREGFRPNEPPPYSVGKNYLLSAEDLFPRAYIPDETRTTGLRNVTKEPQWYLANGEPNRRFYVGRMNDDTGYDLQRERFTLESHELEGSLQEFLASKEGEPWQQNIDNAQRNIRGLIVIGTNNLYALPSFNRGEAYIIEGRDFSFSEMAAGDQVCLISASLARVNGLEVGDEIGFSLQQTGYKYFGVLPPKYIPGDFTPSFTEFTESERYKIIGIYAAPAWDIHVDAFSPNTVFVPSLALPEDIPQTPEYQACTLSFTRERPGMFSLALQHGSEQAFLEQLGPDLAEGVRFFDQGYSRVKPQLEALNRQARGLFLVSALVWVVVMIFFFLLLTRGLRPVLGIMVSLGAERRRLLFFLLSFILILSLCGLAIGGTAGNFAYLRVMNQAYSNIEEGASGFEGRPDPELPEGAPAVKLIEISPRLPLLIVLTQGLVILLVAVLVTIRESRLSARILLESGGKK